MEEIDKQIKTVSEKLQLLLKEYLHAQKELQRLQKENEKLKEELNNRNEQATQLNKKFDALKLNAAGFQEDAKKDLEKRINGYLKDIEKCLALLNT